MTEASTLQILVQGGFAGTTILLIWVVWKLVTNHDSHLLDALDRNTQAWLENAKALQQLVDSLRK